MTRNPLRSHGETAVPSVCVAFTAWFGMEQRGSPPPRHASLANRACAYVVFIRIVLCCFWVYHRIRQRVSVAGHCRRAATDNRLARRSGRLYPSRGLHRQPLVPVVSRVPFKTRVSWRTDLVAGFPLRCCQRFSVPNVATQLCRIAPQLIHQRFVQPGPLVLGPAPRNPPAPTADRDRTVSRRSEPSSRAAFMGEQPNPWDRLQPQDATSRHRGAKPRRRCELLGGISLLSPG